MKDTCASVMGPVPTVLHPETTLDEAIRSLRKEKLRYMPVVNGDGVLVGVFSALRIMANLLPSVMHLQMGKIPQDLNFMHSSLEDFQQRYREMAQRPIGDFIVIKKITYVYPDTSLMEVVNLIHRHQSRIFISERETNKLIGVISIDHLLGQIIGEK